MKSLLLVAHGSKIEESNEEVRELTKALEQKVSVRYDLIETAFLELAKPSIPAGMEKCIQAGADEIAVLSYFLTAGRHVKKDIPALVEQKRREHPDIKITMVPYVGTAQGLLNLLSTMVP